MKSLRELHEDEQREAAWLDSARRLERALRQMRRDWALLQIVVVLCGIAVLFLLLLNL